MPKIYNYNYQKKLNTEEIRSTKDFGSLFVSMKRHSLINFPITIGSYLAILEKIIDLSHYKISAVIYVANVHMYIEAFKNKSFLELVNNADIVVPDGKPLSWALKLLYGIKQERIAGMDILPQLLYQLSQHNLSVFFYGGTQKMLQTTCNYLKCHLPQLEIAGYHSPPFHALNELEEKEIVYKINKSSAAIVFVILGCPKQEKWMASMKGQINAVMIGVGGALPVMIGDQKRAPTWMQNHGLEWFYRFMQEPRRLCKRYLITNSLFICILIKEYIRIKIVSGLKMRS